MTPAQELLTAAAGLRQHQIVVIDHRQHTTYTLRQEDQ